MCDEVFDFSVGRECFDVKAVEVLVRFDLGGNTGSCFCENINPLIGIGDHHMAIEKTATLGNSFTEGSDDGRTDSDVRDFYQLIT